MTLSIVVLPLRLMKNHPPDDDDDLAAMLAAYIEANNNNNSNNNGIMMMMSASECRSDLLRLQQLRQSIGQKIGIGIGIGKNKNNTNVNNNAYEDAMQVLGDMHEYFNCLLECETRGIVGVMDGGRLEWESALTGELQTLGTLEWERANLIWNMATLEAYTASKQKLDSKVGWSKAAQHLQKAAGWLQHIPPSVAHVMDFSDTFLEFWQALLMAHSQRCVYESLACAPRPRHLLLAKLAAAAVPLYGEMETIVRRDEEESSSPLLMQVPTLTNNWADYSRAWGMYMSSKAEYHQAIVSKEKKQYGQELARLDLAFQFASLCSQYIERAPLISLQQLHQSVDADVMMLKGRLYEADQENAQIYNQPVPDHNDLPEIRGEKLVNIDQPLTKLLTPMQGEPMFQGVTDISHLRGYVDYFHTEMDRLLNQMAGIAEERTEAARTALSTVNLPHSLTAYEQEQRGGGIPIPLWDRVQQVQRERRIAKLKQDLWELRDVADLARTTHQKIASQLDFDIESDRLFRQENRGFEGHDAQEVQRDFRQSLGNYDRLLQTAQEGDAVLLKRLEQLDTNPKYKLLQFQKSQLDRLLPGSGGGGGGQSIDTSHLRRLLADLSSLLRERDVLLSTLEEEIKKYDIQGILQERSGSGSEQECKEAVKYAQAAFDGIVYEMQTNIDKQSDMLNTILAENEEFMRARDRQNGGGFGGGGGNHHQQSADSCIAMIEDALDEIEQLSKHLAEGKSFYDVVIPKLEKLQLQVGDVSARLTVERLDHYDHLDQSRQEQADAEMAQRMATDNPAAAPVPPPPGPNGTGGGSQPYPGVPQAGPPNRNAGPPLFCVDDEKVATLVGMDFDPAQVVAALTKHKNDVDQALNELLSC